MMGLKIGKDYKFQRNGKWDIATLKRIDNSGKTPVYFYINNEKVNGKRKRVERSSVVAVSIQSFSFSNTGI